MPSLQLQRDQLIFHCVKLLLHRNIALAIFVLLPLKLIGKIAALLSVIFPYLSTSRLKNLVSKFMK
jgi:hypothetical protein